MELAQKAFCKFTDDLSEILVENLFEIIIHGSYVLGDFRANLGDLDFVVLTKESLDEETNKILFGLHEKYRSEKSLLLHQLEGAYYPKSFMKSLEGMFLGCYIGTSKMKTITALQNSLMDLRLINQHGMLLLGSNCEVFNPSEAELLIEQKSNLQSFKQAISEVSQSDLGFWMSSVHWSARTLFFRAKGVIGSKTQACQWCTEQTELDEFKTLFDFAKSQRFPYENGTLQEKIKISCSRLLDLVDIWSENNSITRIKPTL